MELTGNLKKEVEQAETRAEAQEAIREAGMELTDDELDQVAGGFGWKDVKRKAREAADVVKGLADKENWEGAVKLDVEYAKKAANAIKNAAEEVFYTH